MLVQKRGMFEQELDKEVKVGISSRNGGYKVGFAHLSSWHHFSSVPHKKCLIPHPTNPILDLEIMCSSHSMKHFINSHLFRHVDVHAD